MPAVTRQGYAAGQQITKRLDVLGNLQSGLFGISTWFVRVHLVAGGAWAMAAAQAMSFAYMAGAVLQDLPMTNTEMALLLVGAVMLGAFVGAFIFGYLADTHGRKFTILVAFAVAHVAGALAAVSPNVQVLICLRFISGVGLGGQQPIIASLILELAPTKIRGSALVYLDAFWPIGAIVAMVFCREIEPFVGWRAVVGLSAAALGYLPLLYMHVPESPKWLATSGKIDEAVRVLRTIEQASSVFHGEEADDVIKNLASQDEEANGTKHMILQAHKPSFCKSLVTRMRILMRFPYLSRTVMLWFVWTAMAMTNSAMCVYLDEEFVARVVDSADKTLLTYSVLIAQFFGNISACFLIDRIGRRYTMICFLVVASVASALEVYWDGSTLSMLLSSFLRNFAFYGATGCLFAYTPELYPTSVRVIGIGYAWGISRLGLFAGPHVVFWMEEHLELTTEGVMWIFCGILVSAAVAIFFVGIETANQDVERTGRRSSGMATERDSTTSVITYQKHEDQDDDELAIMQRNSVV